MIIISRRLFFSLEHFAWSSTSGGWGKKEGGKGNSGEDDDFGQ